MMRRIAAILSLIALSLACTPDSGEDAFLDVRRCLSPIHAEGAHDIAITGGGIIDTNAEGTKLKSLSYDRSYMTNICIGYRFSF